MSHTEIKDLPKPTPLEIARTKSFGVHLASGNDLEMDWESIAVMFKYHGLGAGGKEDALCHGVALAIRMRVEMDRLERENIQLRERLDDMVREYVR